MNEPLRCAICGITLPDAHLTFLWAPMCVTHRNECCGFYDWVPQLADRVYSDQELLELGDTIIKLLREEYEHSTTL